MKSLKGLNIEYMRVMVMTECLRYSGIDRKSLEERSTRLVDTVIFSIASDLLSAWMMLSKV